MSETMRPPEVETIHDVAENRNERTPVRFEKLRQNLGRKAMVGLAVYGSFFAQQNQEVMRDLLTLPLDKTDEVVFAIEGIDEPDHIRQHPTDDVTERIAHVRSSADISDENGNLMNTLKNYFDYSLNGAQPLEYVKFLHNFEAHPQAEIISDKTGIIYTVYSDEAEPLWQDYASANFEQDLVDALEYSLEPHSYENSRVQFIQDKLAERTVAQQERAGEHVRVFIPSEPSCLNSGVPNSVLDDPGRDCDAFGTAPRDMSIRWLPFYNTAGFDDVVVLAGGRPDRSDVNTYFEQLAAHEGIHRIHFDYGYEENPHDQTAIERGVKYVEYEIFGSAAGSRNYDHRPISSTEPLIDIAQLYEDHLNGKTATE